MDQSIDLVVKVARHHFNFAPGPPSLDDRYMPENSYDLVNPQASESELEDSEETKEWLRRALPNIVSTPGYHRFHSYYTFVREDLPSVKDATVLEVARSLRYRAYYGSYYEEEFVVIHRK